MLQVNLILTFVVHNSIDFLSCYDILLYFLKVFYCDKVIMTSFPLSLVYFFAHTIIAIAIKVINIIVINVISASVIITAIILMLLLKLISLVL